MDYILNDSFRFCRHPGVGGHDQPVAGCKQKPQRDDKRRADAGELIGFFPSSLSQL